MTSLHSNTITETSQATLILMNRTHEVCQLTYDLTSRRIIGIDEIFNEGIHAPIAFLSATDQTTFLADWWGGRQIPEDRPQVNEILARIHIASPAEFAMLNHGLSLSDQYWMKSPDETVNWEDINYFSNSFSDDIGKLLSGAELRESQLKLRTPDNTSSGMLQKYWTIVNGIRCLMKKGSAQNHDQEPFNEVIATELHARLLKEDSFVPYSLAIVDDTVFSSCPNMLNDCEELVPAQYVECILPEKKGESKLAHFLRCTEALGIEDAAQRLAELFATDYLLANSDRHKRNFGIIRNIETGFCRMAPIFDSGHSLWCNVGTLSADTLGYHSKPFEPVPERQAALLREYLDFEFDRLEGFLEFLQDTLYKSPLEHRQNRILVTYRAVKNRIALLYDIQRGVLDHPSFISR